MTEATIRVVDIRCPECGHHGSTLYDPFGFPVTDFSAAELREVMANIYCGECASIESPLVHTVPLSPAPPDAGVKA